MLLTTYYTLLFPIWTRGKELCTDAFRGLALLLTVLSPYTSAKSFKLGLNSSICHWIFNFLHPFLSSWTQPIVNAAIREALLDPEKQYSETEMNVLSSGNLAIE